MEKQLNDKKVAFIICTNNDLYYEECVWYINQLHIPEGYEKDIIGIQGAESMAEAYNAAMESSDAKYKVYLHHDVFIYHRDFICDILEVFQADHKLGLLGVIGGVDLPQDACIWNAWNRGTTYVCNNLRASRTKFEQSEGEKYTEVEAVDGMLMVTQYDIPWREDLDLGWDFYDISQSLEFRRNGYKVGIPIQETPWCMHDCGHSKLIHYDQVREKILKEYHDFFTEPFQPACKNEMIQVEEELFGGLKICIEKRMFQQAMQIKQMVDLNKIRNNNLVYGWIMTDIYEKENLKVEEQGSFFYEVPSWEDAKDKFDIIKFMIRHVENETDLERVQELKELLGAGVISQVAVCSIAVHCALDYKKVFLKLFGEV